MIFQDTPIEGLKIIKYNKLIDERGFFLKIHNHDLFQNAGLNANIEEIYTSQSSRRVLRGLHYQKSPFAHSKIIFCLTGSIFDVAVDLRKGSSTYGNHYAIYLKSNSSIGFYIPEGFAHGFQALEDNTVIINSSSKKYSLEHEIGICWDSCGINWPLENPILSVKDQKHPIFSDMISDF